jgi:hypothetical protein
MVERTCITSIFRLFPWLFFLGSDRPSLVSPGLLGNKDGFSHQAIEIPHAVAWGVIIYYLSSVLLQQTTKLYLIY